MNVVSQIASDDQYHYGFNGQMKVNEWAGVGNHNTALFWEYDTRTGMRLNRDPRGSESESPYSTFRRNPIMFSDRFGDSVKVADLYKKDENGELVDKAAVKAFELYAATREGKQYLLDHAQQGFTLKGQIVTDLNIEATEEGESSKNGVDISFGVGTIAPGAKATTSPSLSGGEKKYNADGSINRLKLNYTIGLNRRSRWGTGPHNTIRDVVTYAHETFLHGVYMERRYNNDLPSFYYKDADHSPRLFNGSDFDHYGVQTASHAQDILLRSVSFPKLSMQEMRSMVEEGAR